MCLSQVGPICPHVPSYIDILRDGRVTVSRNTSVAYPKAVSKVIVSTMFHQTMICLMTVDLSSPAVHII